MKLSVILLVFGLATGSVLKAQTEKVATIKYEMIHQVTDRQKMFRAGFNDGDSGPTTITDDRIIYLKDTLATYDRIGGRLRMMRQRAGRDNFKMPFEEKTFYDMKNRREISYVTFIKDSGNEYYHTIEPTIVKGEWKELDKTKKILGFNCKKATIKTDKDTYTIWYTTEAGFDYSPMPNLAPEHGLVLKIEGSELAFDATSFENKLDENANFTIPQKGTLLTREELMQKRKAAFQNFSPGN